MTESHPSARHAEKSGMYVKSLISALVFAGILCAALFFSSGRWDWWMAWVYIVLRMGIATVSMLWIASKTGGMLEERFHPGAGVKTWDRPLVWTTTLLVPVTLIMTGLDIRFGWSPDFPLAIQLLALAVWFLGDAFSKWAAAVNRFYSRFVRIQKDREHTVTTQGPYRAVRHPGYAGGKVAGLATPLGLGSLWALIPAGLLAALIVIRTALEDKTLHRELPGYAEYAQRTRYRLVPGVW